MVSSQFWAVLALLAHTAWSKTVTYDWDITWVNAAPDGVARSVIGINGQWPCPSIEVDIGDRVIIHTHNKLGNETTSIHFHGIFQTGSNAMDGPAAVTQCPIPVGGSFTYDFEINQPGTYWYHSHMKGQYLDGFRGPIIVHDSNAPFAKSIDGDFTITLSDWYDNQAPGLLHYFASKTNEDDGGAEPIPDSTLMQDTQNPKFPVQPGKTYLVRIINIGGFVGQYFTFDDHEMTIVEIDGVYTQPKTTRQLYITVAQRYSVLITAQKTARKNYAIMAQMDSGMFDSIPPNVNINSAGFLVYDDTKPLPSVTPISKLDPTDDTKLVPYDQAPALSVDHQIKMDFVFQNLSNSNRAFINGVTYIPQKVPTLYTALSVGDDAKNPLVYGVNSNPFVLEHNKVYEIVLNNYDTGAHPWHLHGHSFQVIARSAAGAGPYPGKLKDIPAAPVRRDTIQVMTGGYLVIRFKADNPGINLFHCHIEWHVEAGLVASFIEAPEEIQKSQSVIPDDHLKACRDQGIPTKGNAAGNTEDHFNLTGAYTVPDPDPWGALVKKPQ